MLIALYPGTFDPVTAGHMEIIERASALFERVVVGVLHNPAKPSGEFTVEERLALLREATQGLANVDACAFGGLLVNAVKECGASVVVRGLRTVADLDIELQMARLNRQLSGVDTLFLASSPALSHVSASMVREIGRYGGGLTGLAPESVREKIERRLLK